MFYVKQDSESEGEDSITRKCESTHENKLLIDELYSVHIDELFTMLFTNSRFFMDIQELRGTTNLTSSPWRDDENGTKIRVLTMTVPLKQSLGPKSVNVTETQTMLACSEPGILYSIDVKLEQSGIPYGDRFFMEVHYCLVKCTDQKTGMEIYAGVKYKKSVMGIVKSLIDKNASQGLEETFTTLSAELQQAIEDNMNNKRRVRHKRKRRPSAYRNSEDVKKSADMHIGKKVDKYSSDLWMLLIIILLFFLLSINIYFYYKLWILDHNLPEVHPGSLNIKDKMTTAYEDFLKQLNENKVLPNSEIEKWHRILTETVKFLKYAEESLKHLPHQR